MHVHPVTVTSMNAAKPPPRAAESASVSITFRLPRRFIDEVDGFARYLEGRTPGLRATRTMALQVATMRGIAVMREAGEGVGEE